jgi:nicotinate-nucleotide adenylyltransferase
MQRHIGLYSGTFDPVHRGHITFAKAAQEAARLDQIIFLPELVPRDKTNVADINHRIAMLELAIADESAFKIAQLTSPQFTIQETLPEIQQLTADASLTLLVGSDVAKTLPYWPGITTLLANTTLAIGIRTGDEARQMEQILQQLPEAPRYQFIQTDHAHMASSGIRRGSDHQQLYSEVANYIHQNNLYQSNVQ